MKYLYVGRFISGAHKKSILAHDKEYNFSGNNFEEKLMSGLVHNLGDSISFLSIPAVRYYSSNYPHLWNKKERYKRDGISYKLVSFLNLPIIKMWHSCLTSLCEVIRWYRNNKKEKCTIIFSSADSYLLLLCVFSQIFLPRSKVHYSLIIPDLPEFLSLNKSKSLVRKILQRSREKRSNSMLKKFDSYTLLTKHMSEFINKQSSSIVMEGLAELSGSAFNEYPRSEEIILYTGTLRSVFGIRLLLDAYSQIPKEYNIKLWICGSGEEADSILKMAKEDSNIKFLGLVSPEESVKLQRKASILVNPRTSEGEYTYYSFPSKVMEYLSSGTNTVMFMLPGIPDEYRDYAYIPRHENAESLKDTIIELVNTPSVERNIKAKQAQEFVMRNKGIINQTSCIIDMINTTHK